MTNQVNRGSLLLQSGRAPAIRGWFGFYGLPVKPLNSRRDIWKTTLSCQCMFLFRRRFLEPSRRWTVPKIQVQRSEADAIVELIFCFVWASIHSFIPSELRTLSHADRKDRADWQTIWPPTPSVGWQQSDLPKEPPEPEPGLATFKFLSFGFLGVFFSSKTEG